MLPDIEFLQKLTNEKRDKDMALRKKLTEEFINLASIKEKLIQRASEGHVSATLFIPSAYMEAYGEIKAAFRKNGFEILPAGSQNEIKVTWYKGDLA